VTVKLVKREVLMPPWDQKKRIAEVVRLLGEIKQDELRRRLR
jgi:hypothetical protein